MDDKLLESLQELKEKSSELVSAIVAYENTEKKSVLRTIRTLSTAVGHAGKNFRAVSVAFEKEDKA